MQQARRYRGPLSVAVVDDDETYRAYAAALLTQSGDADGPVKTWEAADGDGLLDILQARRIDCVVLDYNLGSESGLMVHERIKASCEDAPPVVMLTGDGREQTVIKAFKGGVSEYLPKRGLVRGALAQAVRDAVQARQDELSKRAEERDLRRLSAYDSLTGLFTRAHMDERFALLDERAQRTGARYAVLMIDLSDHGHVVDRFGLVAGDRVTRAFAARLRQATRAEDVCGHFEKTEFLYLIDTDAKRETVRGFLHQLAEALRFEVNLDTTSLTLAPTIGGALCPEDGQGMLGIVDAARRAVQTAKIGRLRSAMASDASPAEPPRATASENTSRAKVEGADEARTETVPEAVGFVSERRSVEREGERRSERRQRVLKQARVVLGHRATTIDCTIRDLSAGGARLRFDTYFSPPAEFDLMMVNSGETRRVRVRWHNGNEVGVEFTKSNT